MIQRRISVTFRTLRTALLIGVRRSRRPVSFSTAGPDFQAVSFCTLGRRLAQTRKSYCRQQPLSRQCSMPRRSSIVVLVRPIVPVTAIISALGLPEFHFFFCGKYPLWDSFEVPGVEY